jgi:two-component system, chemotaxis family, chemotaxis protein CheY
MNTAFRAEARIYARALGIEVRSLPKPIDVSALRVCLADLRQDVRGLPTIHFWGGVTTDTIISRRRHG